MILIISTCADKLHEKECVTPIENVLKENNIEYMLDTMVLDITNDKKIHAVNSKNGYMNIMPEP